MTEIKDPSNTEVYCQGKVRFSSFTMAERTAKARRKDQCPRRPYRCTHCHGFHIGHTLKSRVQK